MRKNYDEDLLSKLKKAELMILEDFAAVCDKYHLRWFAIGGTAIGCARHKGFIPWDDDIDIGMLRSDYDEFLHVWAEELGDRYHLATPETEPYYSSAVVKLMRRGTKFVPPYAARDKADLGMHIDIFIYDNYMNDENSPKQIRDARMWDQLMFLRNYDNPIIPGNGLKKSLSQAACHVIHAALSCLHISPAWMYRKLTKVAERYDHEDADYVTTFQDPKIHDSRIQKSELFPVVMMPFEDIEIPMLKDYMTVLKRYYGDDVMQLPPEEQRVNHAPVKVDFGNMLQ